MIDNRREDPAFVDMVVGGVTVTCKTDDPHILHGDRAIVRRPVSFSIASFEEIEEAGRQIGGQWFAFPASDITEIVGRIVD